jgi:hypothetical protein
VLLIGGWKFFALLVKRERIIKYGWACDAARSAGSEMGENRGHTGVRWEWGYLSMDFILVRVLTSE